MGMPPQESGVVAQHAQDLPYKIAFCRSYSAQADGAPFQHTPHNPGMEVLTMEKEDRVESKTDV